VKVSTEVAVGVGGPLLPTASCVAPFGKHASANCFPEGTTNLAFAFFCFAGASPSGTQATCFPVGEQLVEQVVRSSVPTVAKQGVRSPYVS
jgi:hypothetical protein